MARISEEHLQQVIFFKYVRAKALTDERYKMIYAVPNGDKRHIAVAKRLKDEGLTSGIPDISVDVACNGYHGLKIEMKSKKGVIHKGKVTTRKGRLTETQKEYKPLFEKHGYKYVVCYSADEAIKELKNYFNEM